MPQLDPASYASQLFWLALTFIPLFILIWKVALPRVSGVIEARRQRIAADLDKAAALRDQAAKLLAEYEKTLDDAREKARAELRRAAEEMAAAAAERHAGLGAKLAAEVAGAERRIGAAKEAALANIRAVAGEVAAAATERLIGVRPPADALARAVGDAAEEKR
jgi:F-type H+-transporting ATPase subunit b